MSGFRIYPNTLCELLIFPTLDLSVTIKILNHIVDEIIICNMYS
jgi:hypothetical protein